MNSQVINTEKVTRVEVIDSNGRIYTNYNCKDVEIQLQDDNKTLKIFTLLFEGQFDAKYRERLQIK